MTNYDKLIRIGLCIYLMWSILLLGYIFNIYSETWLEPIILYVDALAENEGSMPEATMAMIFEVDLKTDKLLPIGTPSNTQLIASTTTTETPRAKLAAKISTDIEPTYPPVMAATSLKHEEPRRFSQQEIGSLRTRGDALLAARDVAAARGFYQHAADAGDGLSALRLGETFDPDFLAANLGPMQGDKEQASYWYRRALELGTTDAEFLLNALKFGRKTDPVVTGAW